MGRTTTLSIGGALFATGSLLQATAVNIGMLLLGRMVAGVGLAVTTVSSLLYIGEIAPAQSRGWLLSLFQTHLSFLIFLSGLADLVLGFVSYGWRLAVGFPVLLGTCLSIASLHLPESPTSLLERGYVQRARLCMGRLRFPHDPTAELACLQLQTNLARCCLQPWKEMAKESSRPQLVLSALLTILQQLTGINFLVFYGSQLFSNLGFSTLLAMSVSTAISGCLFLGSLVAAAAVDRIGRRPLLLSGSLVSGFCMLAIAILLTCAQGAVWLPWVVLACVCAFTLSYGWSFGTFGWTYPVEIQHVQTRSVGMSITSFFNVFFSAVAAQSILTLNCTFKEGIFYFFALMCWVATILVWWLLPETKGVSIEAGSAHLFNRPPWVKKHKTWELEDE